ISGKTPFSKSEIKPGTILKITVAKDGYYPLEKEIKILQDKAAILRLQLMRLPKRPGELPVSIPKIPAETEPTTAKPQTIAPKESAIPMLEAEPAFPKPETPKPEEPLDAKPPPSGGPAPESRETQMELDYRDIN
ncbi:MAG: hypothetical protein HYU98_06680, partial [Deltaproteobacteria bacterium]|nr:hypothetical protein [Deltaproteobacteria bacterium]